MNASRSNDRPEFAQRIIHWRNLRKLSQMELALTAGISQKHLSYLELGRSRPSQEMVLLLAKVLGLPLRESNDLLAAAGYAPVFLSRSLNAPEMRPVFDAIELMLRHQEPNPTIVVDRDWNIVLSNQVMYRMFITLVGDKNIWERIGDTGSHNLWRLLFHPQGLQPTITNWSEVAPILLARIRREQNGARNEMRILLQEILQYPSISSLSMEPSLDKPMLPVVALNFARNDFKVKVFSISSTFGTPQDITTDELRIESFFPVDDTSAEQLRKLAESGKADN